MKFGSLFAGIGGFDLGLERAGMKCAWQVEIDPYATRVLEKHWPNVPRFKDVRGCGAHNLEPVDLICGGFPCQPHSLAGRRKGSSDERDLWGEFSRIICELRPRFVVAENVPGLLSTESGRFFGRVLRDLASCGYDAEWQSIPASAFGAPHRRDRVWIVAYPNGSGQWGIQPVPRQKSSAKARAQDDGEKGIMANSNSERELQSQGGQQYEWERLSNGSQDVADPNCKGFSDIQGGTTVKRIFGKRTISNSSWWNIEPGMGRVANGVSKRMDRLKCLGNAIVPQIAEWIGLSIMED